MAAPWSIPDQANDSTAGSTSLAATFVGNPPACAYAQTVLVYLVINCVGGGGKPVVTPDAGSSEWTLVHEQYLANEVLYQAWVAPVWFAPAATTVTFSWTGSHPACMYIFRVVGAKAIVDAQGSTLKISNTGHLNNPQNVAASSPTTLDDDLYLAALFTIGSDGTSGHHAQFFGYPNGATSQFNISAIDPDVKNLSVTNSGASPNTGYVLLYTIADLHETPAKTAPDTQAMNHSWSTLALIGTGVPVGTAVIALEAGENVVPVPPEPCDEGGPIQSFMYFNGEEIANGARTLAYMDSTVAGDCQPKFEISPGCPCWIEKVEALGDPDALFRGPALDPAPWYDVTVPASGEFLGLLIDNDSERMLFDGLSFRTVTPRLGGLTGAQIGPDRKRPREWVVDGWLIASTCAGMEFGRRWLQNALQGTGCDPCLLGELRVRASCPPCDGSDNTEGEWYIYEVGLTDGPRYSGAIDPDCCCAERVQFTLTAGNPYLYRAPVVCVSDEPVIPTFTTCVDFETWFCTGPDPICCSVDPPAIGTLAAIVTINAGTGVALVEVATYLTCPPGTELPLTSLTISSLPADTSLTIDSAKHQVTFTDAAGVTSDGTPYIELPDGQGIPWVEVGDCNEAQCICVGLSAYCGSDGSATVTIYTQQREA